MDGGSFARNTWRGLREAGLTRCWAISSRKEWAPTIGDLWMVNRKPFTRGTHGKRHTHRNRRRGFTIFYAGTGRPTTRRKSNSSNRSHRDRKSTRLNSTLSLHDSLPIYSWEKAYTSEPSPWFHDILRRDGTPYDPKEVEFIKSITSGAKHRENVPAP